MPIAQTYLNNLTNFTKFIQRSRIILFKVSKFFKMPFTTHPLWIRFVSYFHTNYRKFNTASGLLVCLRSDLAISDSLADDLLKMSQNQVDLAPEKAGRATIYFGELRSGEKFALRRYVRGGFAKRVATDSYLSLPRSSLRPLLEMEITANLYAAGVRVVEPLFSIIQYGALGLSYSGAIATSEVIRARNFMEVAHTLPIEDQAKIAKAAGTEAARVLKAGIFHRDLHPGNVVLNTASEPILLDFDKAIRFNAFNIGNYIDPLIDRWGRAVKKRSLDPIISSAFKEGVKEELPPK